MEGEAFGRRGIPAQVASKKEKEKAGREGDERKVHLSGTIGGWDSASSHGMVVVLRLRSRDQPDSADKGGGVVQVCVTKRGSTQNVPMDVDKVKANEYLSTLESVRRGGEYARPGSLLAVWMYNFRCRGGPAEAQAGGAKEGDPGGG